LVNKGLGEIFSAAKTLPNYEFWLVGDPTTGNIRVPRLANVKILGFVDHDAIVRYYNQASVCVFPSYWENFPLVGLEALACGKAIIATRMGFSEFVENGQDGLLIEPRRPDQLVESIKYLMQDGAARAKLERNARSKALKYDWGVIMEMYRNIYRKFD
jgi:glycosyltransferase involved in cell wall biosynthesis